MERKVLAAFLLMGLVAAMAGAGLYAYLVDTETSTGNTFSASSGFDLKTMDWDETEWKDGVALTWTATDMKPGDEFLFPGKWVSLSWTGPLTPSSLEVTCDYGVIEESPQTEADTDPNTNLNPDKMAKKMIIKSMKYNGVEYVDAITDFDNDGKKTFYDLKNSPLTGLPIPEQTNSGTYFRLQVKFSEDAGNDFQGDTFNLTMIFTLKQ